MKTSGAVHRLLLILQTQINAQNQDLKLALKFLMSQYQLDKLSSVYLAYSNFEKGSGASGRLSVAATFLIREAAVDVQRTISRYLLEHPRLIEIYLAAYDDQTVLSPDMTLPHPELHVRPEWLIPSSEIWGDYPHPILARPLEDIAADADWGGWGQFHSQGATLIDSPK